MKFLATTSLMLLCSTAVLGHFTVTYPGSRGFDEDKEPQAPCGSFDTVTNRTEFPLSKGFIEIDSGHVKADIAINLVLNQNPTSADFTAAAATPAAKVSIAQPDANCLPVDLSAFAGAKDGVNGTLQIVYNGGDSPLYQCIDVTLKSNAAAWDPSKCTNAATPTTGPTPSPTGSAGSNKVTGAIAVLVAVTAGFLAL
ncbi:hypothetical protein DFQ27_003458 [Actinomortierella ambigua]|uniref:Copper acquisition factor BIM1-like domain-containing protein n=1 Tax=Actinomortierella ambigua TaxID=1343610 RepID=A0A9P6Q6Q5_9FUNG|nr:hypothetical protein DFQ26_002779 [Actinomortierella ambigua]KAG0260560.1 hypothetical protein DFQ27_003458 [Actinomortierella ambigua]